MASTLQETPTLEDSYSENVDVKLSFLPERLRKKLLPFQEKGIIFALQRNGRCMIADEMGLGKTIQAIAVSYYYKNEWPLLIVVPSSLRYPWVDEMEKWIPELSPDDISIIQNKTDTGRISTSKVTILGYGLLTSDAQTLIDTLYRQNFKVVVIDESHYMKSRNATRSKILLPVVQKARRAILLTGTPALGRPEELFMQIEALFPRRFGTWSEYAKKYCNARVRFFGKRTQWDCRGASNLEELHQLLSEIMIRRLKNDVLTQLPPKVRQRIPFDLPEAAAKTLNTTFAEWEKLMRNLNSDANENHFSQVMNLITRMYKETAIAKAGAVKDYIKMMLANDKLKFLVFAHHLSMLQACTEAVIETKVRYIRIDGSVPSAERIHLVNQFQKDPDTRVAILSIQAAGQGLTFTAATHVVFAELYWDPGHIKQAEDRAHRIGQCSSVNIHFLIAKGTMDTLMWAMLNRKAKVTGSTLNGKKEKMQAEEGDKEKWDFLSSAETWTPNESLEDPKNELLFTHFEKERQHDIRSFFSPKSSAEKKRKTLSGNESLHSDSKSAEVTKEEDAEKSSENPNSTRMSDTDATCHESTCEPEAKRARSLGGSTPIGSSKKKKSSLTGKEPSLFSEKNNKVLPCGLNTSSQSSALKEVWHCSVCTYSNNELLPYCEMCSSPQSSNVERNSQTGEDVSKDSRRNEDRAECNTEDRREDFGETVTQQSVEISKRESVEIENEGRREKQCGEGDEGESDTSPIYDGLMFCASRNTDRIHLYSKDGEPLNHNFIPLDIQLDNWEDLPDSFQHKRNRSLILRFVKEWTRLTAMKQKTVRKSGQVFCSPIHAAEELSKKQSVVSSTKRLIVRNFWSDETRLPANILDRMLALLNSLYSAKIETQYLSLITNFLLEMTSKSPDYSRKIFEHPLSECKFQDFVIDSSWRYRSTVLTPMFVETQASQSIHRNSSQERSLSASGSVSGRVRATQQQYEFTPTQHVSGRSSFNWLTGSSIDTLAEYTVPSSSESLSSSMLLVNKGSEKLKQANFKPVGLDFGKKRLGLPGDEVDSKTKGIEERAEILRLRRRFLKDQEKLSLIYARKGVAEQKREKEMKSELKMKCDAQVTLYRSYRVGDLPDIQIEYCSLIAPLQALAQKDPTFAKQLFSSLFGGIFHEVKKSKTSSEKKVIIQKLLNNFNDFLSMSLSYFPPFIACIQEMSYRHRELLDLDSVNVSTSCLASLQQPVGILLLEHALMSLSPAEEPPSKRMRGRTELPPDVIRWIELAKLYRSLGDYDVLRGIFSGKIGTKEITQKALLAEARNDYAEAAKYYDEALSKEDWQDGEPTEAEKDFWELASLECYDHLTEWKSLEYWATVNIDSGRPPDLSKTWNDPFFQETYLPYIIRSKLKLLLSGENDQTLLTFIDEAMKTEQKKAIIEMHYSQELSLLYILQDDFDRARYYISNGMQIFMQSYSSIDTLLHQSRMTKLQSIQALTEIQDFINFMTKRSNLASQASLKRLLRIWTSRYPDAKVDPMNIWDDIITNRCFFLDKLQEKLLCDQADDSMEVDEEYSAGDQMEVDQQSEDIYSMIKSCKFNMKMKMIESARKQNSFSVAKKLLKDLSKEAKTREDWLVTWNYACCRFMHSCSQNQSCPERVLSVLKTISLLEDTKSDYLSKNITAFRNQNLLLGTTYHIIANALSQDPRCLEQIEKEKAGKISLLSGESLESPEKILASLNKKAFQSFSSAARKSEEEVQSHSMDHVDVMGVIDAYMTLVGFCDQHLRREEEGLLEINTADLQLFPAIVVEKMIKALKLNSREARLRFPRLLQIIERYPAETLGLVTRELSSVPCWQFIGWISQMMALLDKDEAVAVQHTVEEIADTYPQAIIYPFMISSESYCFKDTATGCKNKEFVERIKNKLDRGGVVQDFVCSLEQLSNPIMLFKDWVEDVRNELVKAQRNKNKLKELYEGMYKNLGNSEAPGLGLLRKRFIQAVGKDFDHHFGKGGSELLDMKTSDFNAIATSLLSKMNKNYKEPGNLKECSPWMSEFKAEFLRNELEVPGQYDGKGKPLPEYHARISGFDERIRVMESLRKPKRITIRGSDEQEYPFLVKGGEDLRQDQRIEQLFDVMNTILSQDATCSQRNMQLKTYQVIPMTTRLGLIKWLENTCTLKEFLKNSMSEEEDAHYNSEKGPRATYSMWLSKMGGKEQGVFRYHLMYRNASRTETVTSFKSRESSVPEDLLRRAFVKMSTSPEAFLSLRSHFASSHALLCISHWILGIGDRHLSNFMINKETGGMVGIDFGYAFGSATQFLGVPELMPFRLTRQFVNLMMPVKEWGLIYSVMVYALRAYRADPDLLISTMDVFVKEPSLDWKNFEQRQLKKGGTWIKEINTADVNWFPLQKVNYVRRKLTGANPATITCDELRLGQEKSLSYSDFAAVARGNADHNVRAKEPEDGLSEETQVRCLIDQATDPNVLGRVWEGWEPWM